MPEKFGTFQVSPLLDPGDILVVETPGPERPAASAAILIYASALPSVNGPLVNETRQGTISVQQALGQSSANAVTEQSITINQGTNNTTGATLSALEYTDAGGGKLETTFLGFGDLGDGGAAAGGPAGPAGRAGRAMNFRINVNTLLFPVTVLYTVKDYA